MKRLLLISLLLAGQLLAHADVTVIGWGDNGSGQSSPPTGLSNAVAISAGYGYSLALKADGTVIGWGNQPAAIPDGLSNITAIASGVIFSLALKSDGTVVAWGDDTYGQIDVPAGLSNVVAIAAGAEHSIVLKNDGTVVAWGYDSDGQIDVPAGLSNVVAVAGGNYHTLALRQDGSVLSWGGYGGGFSVTSAGLSNVVALASEYYASVALTADGSIYSWSEFTPVDQAELVDGFTNIIAIAAFYDHFMALKNDGTVMVTGDDPFGVSAVPAGLSGVIGIATGGLHGLALVGSGAVTIVQQPVPRTLYSGLDATFSVGAIGTPPLNYQWQLGGTNLVGATNNILTITNAQPSDMGLYRVVVTGPASTATSASAALSLLLTPPIITLQPVGQANWLGASATFTAAATGSQPLYYQWQFNGTNLDGATNIFLNLTNLQTNNMGFYSLVVSNAYGVTNSSSVPLTVGGLDEALNATNLIWQTYGDVLWFATTGSWPHDGVAAAAGSAPSPGQQSILQTMVTGPGTVTFWWKVDQPVFGFNLSMVVNGSVQPLTSAGMSWQQQTCYVGAGTNVLQWIYANTGPYVDSVSGYLDQVNYVLGGTAPMITGTPGNQTQPAGTNVTFNVIAIGTPPLNYQWLFNGLAISGATNFTYIFNLMDTNQAGNYSVVVTNDYGSVTSSPAILTVFTTPPGISSQPTSQLVPGGSNATFSVVASGSPPFSYQWLFNGATMDGQTNSILSLSSVTTNLAGAYGVWVSSPYGSVTSHIATLTVGWLPTITSQPTNQTLLSGSRALMVAGVSGVGPLTFQWQLNGTNLPNNLITTIAGNGTSGFAGDGGIATTGKVNFPYGVAADGAGNVFIVDSSNYRIRKVDLNGVMTTVAGKGVAAFYGDCSAATNAYLNTSYGMAVDGMGNLFIADTYNNRIRKVDTNGIITTVAGKSSSGFSGDGGAATNAKLYYPYGVMVDTNGNLFIADTYNHRIRKVDTNGVITTVAGKSSSGFSGDGGAATNANLYRPQSVAMDGNGNLFIADAYNYRVRKVDVYGVITTIAGNGSTSFSGDNGVATNAGMNPFGVSVDGYGDVLIADRSNNRIRRVDPYGIITTVAGTNSYGYGGDGVAATNAPLYYPSGVAMDSYGRILIADTYNNRIRRFGQGPTLALDKLTAANAGNYTLVVSSSYGSVTSTVATLTVLLPPAIVSPLANQTAGLGSNATFTVNVTGTAPLVYQWQMNGTNLAGQTGQSLNLTNAQWSDAGNYQVVITNNYGSITSAVATMTVGLPSAIAGQPTNQIVLVGSNGQLSVVVTGDGPFTYQWRLNGTNLPPIITTVAGTSGWGFSGDGGSATNAKLNFPEGVAIDAAGNLFIADYSNNRIRKVDTNGIITTIAGTGTQGNSGNGGLAVNATLYRPAGVTFDAAGNLYISEYGNGDVRKVDTNGIITRVAGTGTVGTSNDGGQATNSQLYSATGAALDSNGNLYINESAHCRIRKVGTNGIITTVAGNTDFITGGFSGDGGLATNAQLNTPCGIALDSSGNVFIADNDNSRVRKVDTNGIINTIVGGGSSSSDGLLGTNTLLSYAYGVGLDRYNNLYITTGSRVRKMDTNGIMMTVAGGGNNNPGDYGPATSAKLSSPRGVAFDSQGNLYIADIGYNRIRKVHFSGDPTLQLLNASVTNSGNYSVLITSPYGSVVSSVASFMVVVPPTIQTFNWVNGQFNLTWNTASNMTYQVQYSSDLSTTNWINLGNPITATNGSVTVSDVPGADSQRFYRIKMN